MVKNNFFRTQEHNHVDNNQANTGFKKKKKKATLQWQEVTKIATQVIPDFAPLHEN